MDKLQDIYTFENQFSKNRIDWFRLEMEKLRLDKTAVRQRTTEEKKKNQLFMIKPGTPLRDEIEELFSDIFPFERTKYKFYSTNFYEISIPYILHCDNLGEGRGFYQMVVPLEIAPVAETYTLIFDQTSDKNTEWISPAYRHKPDYKPHHNVPIYDPNYFGGWSDEYKISDHDGEKYWGPEWARLYREAYKGFSLKKAFKWNVGDALLFHSKYNHCAAEMSFRGIERKSGLLICLENVT